MFNFLVIKYTKKCHILVKCVYSILHNHYVIDSANLILVCMCHLCYLDNFNKSNF